MVRTKSSSWGALDGRRSIKRKDMNPGKYDAIGEEGSDGINSPRRAITLSMRESLSFSLTDSREASQLEEISASRA